ncbi:MAG: hypothetical protein AB1894_06060 [Chloroflexota bacterium]
MSTRRLLRLSAFALLVILLAYAVISTGMAWVYSYAFTHPGCIHEPAMLPGVPAPQEQILLSEDGLQLKAWYYPSQNGAAIIALGGLGGSLGTALPPVEFLLRQGYGVLQIDSRACAQPASAVTLGAGEAQDAAAGLAFLQSRPEVHAIGAFGFSMGGVTAVRAAARHPEIAAVVDDGGYFNLGDDFVEPGEPKSLPRSLFLYTIATSFWLQSGANPWQISPIDDLPRISPRPVLLIYGEGEAASGRAQAQFAAAGQPKELWIVPGGSHGRNHLAAPQEYPQRLLDFFAAHLLGPIETQPTATAAPTTTRFMLFPGYVTFDYPSRWKLYNRGTDVYATDPDKPKPPVFDEKISVNIAEFLVSTEKLYLETSSLDKKVDNLIGLRRIDSDFSLIHNATLSIDDYPARHLIFEISPRNFEGRKYYDEFFLLVNDYFYWFGLDTLVSERDGLFGQEYDALIRSIQVVEK